MWLGKLEEVGCLERQVNNVQSMVNFHRLNPHKYDQATADEYLGRLGLGERFAEVAAVYLGEWRDQVNTNEVDSFTSEHNKLDISNRSLLKNATRKGPVGIKRVSSLNSILDGMEAVTVVPSRHSRRKDLGPIVSLRNLEVIAREDKERRGVRSAGGSPRRMDPPGDTGPRASIFKLLYINEMI